MALSWSFPVAVTHGLAPLLLELRHEAVGHFDFDRIMSRRGSRTLLRRDGMIPVKLMYSSVVDVSMTS